ncbi:protein FAN-like isoform X3 [Vespula squamosa]|uniref:Protein FAN-like isoform X3 n=1 Tax=Vespula squamosa TaxID=30214 RepID=A0ABD2BYV4_VESSQ
MKNIFCFNSSCNVFDKAINLIVLRINKINAESIFCFTLANKIPNSVADVWKNVLVNMSDFKELIPEFYDTNNGGDFLVNSYGIDFGYRHDGTKIGDVQLPPWAEVDLDTIRDINDRHGLEVQIMEFGQIPKQVFTLPHPKRLISIIDTLQTATLTVSHMTDMNDKSLISDSIHLSEFLTFQSHKEGVCCITVTNKGTYDEILSVGHDGMFKLYSIKDKKPTRSVSLSSLPLSSCISYYTASSHNILVVGSWDNTLIFYDIEFGRTIDTLQAHEDAVSCLAWSPTRQIIISGSWDCTAKVWRSYVSGPKIKPSEYFIAQLDHDSKITCIDISSNEMLLVSGTEDGELFLWSMDNYNLQFTVKGHTGKVNAMTFDPECKSIISCAEDQALNIIDIHTSTQIYHTSLEHEALTLKWIGMLLLIGDSIGNISLWKFPEAAFLSKIHCHDGPLFTIAITTNNSMVITGGKDRKVIVWECKKE